MNKFKFVCFLLILLIGSQLYSCVNRDRKEASVKGNNNSTGIDSIDTNSSIQNIRGIRGKFVNYTFLDRISNAIIGHIPIWCYEMNFDSADSVKISFNGYESPATFSYKKEGSAYRLISGWNSEHDLFFTLNQDSSITLIDSKSIGEKQNSVFCRVNPKFSLAKLINERTVSGEYTLWEKGSPTKRKVVLEPNGKVTGLASYTAYSICYSGDCVEMSLPLSNIIEFYKGGEEFSKMYAFKLANHRLLIYRLGESPPDIKGEMPIKELAFDLRR